jgi:hypothetical protein
MSTRPNVRGGIAFYAERKSNNVRTRWQLFTASKEISCLRQENITRVVSAYRSASAVLQTYGKTTRQLSKAGADDYVVFRHTHEACR